jgi:hypothetical protein
MKRKAIPLLAIASLATAACTANVADPAPSTQAPNQVPTEVPTSLDTLNEELSTTILPDALVRRDHFRPLCDDFGFPLVGNINAKGARASEFCAAIRELAPVKAGPTCDPKARNEELSEGTMLDAAIEDRAHFRCICDDEGYPLVGNINAKGTTASEFCATLREKNLL